MKAAHILPLAALAAVGPFHVSKRQSSDARLVISTGNGDAATTLGVGLEQTVVTNFFNRNSVKTAVNEQGIFCGGFQDSGATVLIGSVFDSTNPAQYSQTSTGGTGSRSEDATVIGSYWCSRNKMAVERRATQVVAPQPIGGGNGGNNGGNDNTNNNGGNTGGSTGGNNGGATVDVQIEQVSDQFIGVTIPLNQLTSNVDNRQLGDTIIVLDVVRGNDVDNAVVNCQAFSDREGNEPLGDPATVDEAVMVAPRRTQPAPFGSILCSDSPIGSGNNNNNNGGGGGDNARGEVRLQIETASDEFRGTSVPVNQLVRVRDNSQLVGRAIRIDVVGGDDGGNINDANIRCQAWADEQGNQPIGRPATVDLASELTTDRSDPADFLSITCNA